MLYQNVKISSFDNAVCTSIYNNSTHISTGMFLCIYKNNIFIYTQTYWNIPIDLLESIQQPRAKVKY